MGSINEWEATVFTVVIFKLHVPTPVCQRTSAAFRVETEKVALRVKTDKDSLSTKRHGKLMTRIQNGRNLCPNLQVILILVC